MRVVLYVLLGILALIILLCLVPMSVKLKYENGSFRAFVKILGIFKVMIYPEGKKKKKPEKTPQEDANAAEKETKGGKPPEISEFIRYATPAIDAAEFLFHHISVKDIIIIHIVRGYEPHGIGIKTGNDWGAFGALTVFLKNNFRKVVFKRVEIVPDFADEYGENEKYCCKFGAIAGIMVAALIIFFTQKDKEKREDANNEAEEKVNG